MPSGPACANKADNRAVPKKEKPPPGPDDVVRESAGAYVSGDGRFRVTQSDTTWFVQDTEQANEFGQELIHGPFGSLKQAQASLAGVRAVKPLLRSVPRPKKPAREAGGSSSASVRVTQPAPKPPPSWIDRLEEAEQKEVRRLIRALEKEGLTDAEELVRRHRDDTTPTIATQLIQHRLRELVAAQPSESREAASALVQRVADILTLDGLSVARPLPRWALLELAADESTPKRTIRPRR
jgi:hypothetical protein